MSFPPADTALKKLRREVALHAAQTEIAPTDEHDSVSIRDEQKRLHTTIIEMDTRHRNEKERLHTTIAEQGARHNAELQRVHQMMNELEARSILAFPNADLIGHHAEHLSIKEKYKFWQSLRMTTGMAAFWVALAMMLIFAFTSRK